MKIGRMIGEALSEPQGCEPNIGGRNEVVLACPLMRKNEGLQMVLDGEGWAMEELLMRIGHVC
jgi:hypothetical protein